LVAPPVFPALACSLVGVIEDRCALRQIYLCFIDLPVRIYLHIALGMNTTPSNMFHSEPHAQELTLSHRSW